MVAAHDLNRLMAHDIRNPLSVVSLALNLISNEDLPDETRVLIEEVADQTNLANELINDFLDIQRLEEGTFSMKIQEYGLADLLGDRRVIAPSNCLIRCDVKLAHRMIDIHRRGAEQIEIRVQEAADEIRLEFVGRTCPSKLALKFCEAAATAQGGKIGVHQGREGEESRWISFPKAKATTPK